MRLKLRDGDYVADGAGGFVRAEGMEAVLEQALFRLTARRGGFSPIPELGSRLYTLHRVKPEARDTMAKIYAQEALTPMGLRVTNAAAEGSGDTLHITLDLSCQGTTQTVEVTIR